MTVDAARLPRTLIVGIDGASPDLLFGMIDRGELPALEALRRRSAWGVLRSTLPPMTLPAWSSFLCGCGPGAHGIFDFFAREPGTGRLRFVDARDRAVPTIPRLLDGRGWRVGTFLFPTTWPPVELSGGQVSGFDSPVATRVPVSACAPPSLHGRIRTLLGRDLAYADFSELRKGRRWEERAAAALLRGIEDKERLAVDLVERGPPYDLFALLFGEVDTACHHFWHLADPLSPRHDPEGALEHGDLIAAVYRRIDAAVGRLLEAGPGWERVIIASDHGFGPASDRVLHLNAFLAERGFLRFRGGPGAAGEAATRLARLLPPRLLEEALRRAPDDLRARAEAGARWGRIDLSRTEAFSDEASYAPSIRLNLAGRDPGGIVPGGWAGAVSREALIGRLERALLDWTDPIDGGSVVRAVHRREAIYSGPCVARAPDLVLELETPGGCTWNVLPSRPGAPAVEVLPRPRWRGAKGGTMSGSHRRDGVYMLTGRSGERGEGTRQIADLLPDWLRSIGLSELLEEGAPAAPEPSASDAEPLHLARRLRGLGYLD